MRALTALLLLALPTLAVADGRGVTVVNGSGEAIKRIEISAAGSSNHGENRLRSTLPPGAQGHIGYSTGCRVDVRLGFESGRTEEFLDQDACTDLRVTGGKGVTTVAAAATAPAAPTAQPKKGKPGKTPPFVPVKVEVPPWTGHSITKKFGGLQ
jgi:hypothetical protein